MGEVRLSRRILGSELAVHGYWSVLLVGLVWVPALALAWSAGRARPRAGLRTPPSAEVVRYERMMTSHSNSTSDSDVRR